MDSSAGGGQKALMTGRRFLTLDAMRGIAALAVVSVHFAGRFSGPRAPHGFLAVDAFFVLSGFVLALAYDKRLERRELSVRQFMALRVKRLAPLFYLGLALGLLAQLLHPDPTIAEWRAWALAATLLAIPSFPGANGNFFALNNPAWSLFLELWVANLTFALFWQQLHGWALSCLVAVSAIGLIVGGVCTGSLAGGWSYPTIWMGFFRVGFSFFAGVMVARRFRAAPPRHAIPAAVILAALASILAVPFWGQKGLLAELLGVLAIFPILTFYGAKASHMPEMLGRRLGDGSYAAYTVHYPLLTMTAAFFTPWVMAHRTPAQVLFLIVIVGLSLAAAEWDAWVRKTGRWAPQVRAA